MASQSQFSDEFTGQFDTELTNFHAMSTRPGRPEAATTSPEPPLLTMIFLNLLWIQMILRLIQHTYYKLTCLMVSILILSLPQALPVPRQSEIIGIERT